MRFLAPVSAFLLLLSAPATADTCTPVRDALLKGLGAPWHSTMTLKVVGKETKTYEVINTADQTFQRDNKAHWRKKFRRLDLDEAKIRRDWANSVSCKDDGKEAIGGMPASIVRHHIDTRYWISDTTGLILKSQTIDFPATLTTEYTYDNIAAPSLE